MNINLTPDLEALVREGIAAGRFRSAEDAVREALSIWVSGGVQPALRLSLLKRQKFTPEGRQARIAASLAALHASQPTDLPMDEWKAIVEEIEDED
jgi:Arc/MetJ-type ribon-helix-helix transcriptional regulator